MRSRALLLPIPMLLAGALVALAQNAPDDPLRDHFFPPELVMQNQQALAPVPLPIVPGAHCLHAN